MKFRKIQDALIVLTCALIVIHIGIQRYRRTLGPQPPNIYRSGSVIEDTAELELAKSPRTLLIVTASTCHFCTASMPFYRRLLPAAKIAGVQVIAVTAEDPDVNRGYLASHGAQVVNVISSMANHIYTHATPTLLLIRRDGKVIDSWVGKLNPSQEKDVLNAIGSTSKDVI